MSGARSNGRGRNGSEAAIKIGPDERRKPTGAISLKSKMVRGIPDSTIVPLEIVRLPDLARWATNNLGMVVGLSVPRKGVVAFAPVALPRMKIKRLCVRVDYASEDEKEAICEMQFRYFDPSYAVKGLQSPPLLCTGKPCFVFEIPVSHLEHAVADPAKKSAIPDYEVFTSAIEINPGPFPTEPKAGDEPGGPESVIGGRPVVLRCARLEIHGG
jgi:hypothetical protein